MAELKKQWSDGELLTVVYNGDRDGSATFTSDVNESIDREMVVTYVDKDRKVSVAQMVKQAGLREVFNVVEGTFMVAEGTFNVLKE
jgi:protein associated with RNAse G/E